MKEYSSIQESSAVGLGTASDLQDCVPVDYLSDSGITQVQSVALHGIRTESGFEFDQVEVAFQTLGSLSPKKDNAILICHALSGDAHVAGINAETGRPGWWDRYVGPGKAIDTGRFFVIASNVLGGCSGTTGPASINPQDGKPYATRFPPVTIRDMVEVQTRLLDHLGIGQVFAVIGGSMGGMQALSMAVDYPERARYCIPIATTLANSPIQIAFNEIGRQAILADPNWQGGLYDPARRPELGLAVARMAGHVTYLSKEAMEEKFGRRLQRPPSEDDLFPELFSVESYLLHQGKSFVKRFDPNSYLYISKAIDRFDLLNNDPERLRKVQARFLVVSFESDWLYPPAQSRDLVKVLKRAGIQTTYLNLDTRYGHDSFLIDNPPFSSALGHFLNRNYPVTVAEPD